VSDWDGRIERLLRQRILPQMYGQRTPVEVTVAHLPGEPLPFAEAVAQPFEPIEVGQPWGSAWSTSWFRIRGTVPDALAGRRVELLVDLGFRSGGPGFEAEGLVWNADGEPVKGIEPRNLFVPITSEAAGGEMVDLYVEAAANPSIGGDAPTDLGDRSTAPAAPLYRLARAELAVLEPEVQALAIEVQVLFELAGQLPAGDPRRERIRAGLTDLADELGASGLPAGAAGARALIADLLASPATASAHRISAVGHAHIDSAWLWPIRETVRKCARTFSNVVSLADAYPELRFACSSAQQYAWVRERYPQLFARIKQKVASGQFVPVGGMWVESDTNMPGGESLVRQFVQGQRFFAEEFGVDPQEVWLPDSFGYSGALPQIARLAGCRWFLSQKMSWNQTNRFPHHTFWWAGIDGSRIFTHFPPSETYSSKLSGEQLAFGVRNFADLGPANRSLLPFGYGDGGGGPTREMLEIARRVTDLEGSPRVVIESPAEFFAGAQAEYPQAPVWTGEMYLEFHRATYTSQLAMKQGNRRTEHLLREAELWAATATVRRGTEYPYDELDRHWQRLLLHQFHDILPGSSIAWVHREARAAFDELARDLGVIIDSATAALAGDGDLPLSFNAAPHPRDGVPALGASVVDADSRPVEVIRHDDGSVMLDNGLLRVQIGADGTVHEVLDLVADRSVLTPGAAANVLQLHPDQPVRFDAWDIDEYYRHRGRELREVTEFSLDTTDPARPRIVVTRTAGESRYRQTTSLGAGQRRVDFDLDVDWHERETVLKAAFPIAVHAQRSTSEIQFGHVHRSTSTNTSWDAARFEICAHRWLQVAEPGYGVAVVNDSTYGHDVSRPEPGDARRAGGTTVRLSLVRAPRYPDPQTDQGRHLVRYALVCGAEIDDAVREGYRINLPERLVRGAAAVGPLVDVSGGGAVVEAVKLADDRSGDVVVRLYESRGGRGTTTVRPRFETTGAHACDVLERAEPAVAALAPLSVGEDGAVTVDLGPFQVVTLRFGRDVG
jgi:alpha-mannosidase